MRRLVSAFRRLAQSLRGDAVPAAQARVPDGLIVYAVGDIHGENGALDKLLGRIRDDSAENGAGLSPIVVFLGDYVDRGPDSRGVLDRLCGEPLPGFTVRFLLGNHEQAMLRFLDAPHEGADWLAYGGAMTLTSYEVPSRLGVREAERNAALSEGLAARLPAEHRCFLETLETSVVYGDYAFVHAGIRPGRPLAMQTAEDLLWIRQPFLDWPDRHEKVIVHGHTLVDAPQILPNRIGIDTGAYATGVLTAVVLQGDGVRILQARR